MATQAVDPSFFHALVLLNLLFIAAAWSLARPSYRSAAVLALSAFAWFMWNGQIEGRVLVFVTIEHGFTESDVLSILGIAIAAVTAVRTRERRRHTDSVC
ncbi:hypothetical protein [Gordonia aurantiaca]|uniref:hypothetical protein n=1 Tax=Gordonia sp. B21 TaxID=3151852 RepID=UPI00326371A8